MFSEPGLTPTLPQSGFLEQSNAPEMQGPAGTLLLMTNSDQLTPIQLYCRGVSAFDRQRWGDAIESLSSALSGLHVLDTPAEFKAAHYYLARAFESLGIIKSAEEHYTEVLVVDYTYKDTLQRMERLQSM